MAEGRPLVPRILSEAERVRLLLTASAREPSRAAMQIDVEHLLRGIS